MDRSRRSILVGFVTAVVIIASPWRGQSEERAHVGAAPDTLAAQAPSSTCRTLLNPSWQEQEQMVWLLLCGGHPADLDTINGDKRDDDWNAITRDERRHLSAAFITTIFGNPAYQTALKDNRIRLSGAFIDDFNASGLQSRSLTLTNVVIAQGARIYDCNFEDSVDFEAVKIYGNIDINNLVARRLLQRYSQTSAADKSIIVTDSRLEGFLLSNDDDPVVSINTSRISQVNIDHLGKTSITLWKVVGSDIDIKYSAPVKVSLSELWLTGSVRIIGVGWAADATGGTGKDPPLVLSYIAAQEFDLLSVLPSRLGIGHAGFQLANFGPNPLSAIPRIEPVGDDDGPTYLPFLAAMARFYTIIGRTDIAREVTYESNRRAVPPPERPFDRAVWMVRLVSVGFGQRVYWGIFWIMGLIIIGWGVFRLGSHRLVSPDKRPTSWLLFSLDTVIPVIHLNKAHEEIAFTGWPQWYMYFLRIMGAVLAFFVFFFLKQAILGSE